MVYIRNDLIYKNYNMKKTMMKPAMSNKASAKKVDTKKADMNKMSFADKMAMYRAAKKK